MAYTEVEILAQARSELMDAIDSYEREQEGLGLRLWLEVDEHIRWIARHPTVLRPRPGGYRRVNLKVFPYYIAYTVADKVRVVAIGHGRRKPKYWIDRLR